MASKTFTGMRFYLPPGDDNDSQRLLELIKSNGGHVYLDETLPTPLSSTPPLLILVHLSACQPYPYKHPVPFDAVKTSEVDSTSLDSLVIHFATFDTDLNAGRVVLLRRGWVDKAMKGGVERIAGGDWGKYRVIGERQVPADNTPSSSGRSRSSSVQILENFPNATGVIRPTKGRVSARLDKGDETERGHPLPPKVDCEPTGPFCSPGLGPLALCIVGQDPDLSRRVMRSGASYILPQEDYISAAIIVFPLPTLTTEEEIKIYQSLGRGHVVVHSKWVEDSLEAGRMVSVSKYPVSRPSGPGPVAIGAMAINQQQRRNATPGPSAAGPVVHARHGRPSKSASTATSTSVHTPFSPDAEYEHPGSPAHAPSSPRPLRNRRHALRSQKRRQSDDSESEEKEPADKRRKSGRVVMVPGFYTLQTPQGKNPVVGSDAEEDVVEEGEDEGIPQRSANVGSSNQGSTKYRFISASSHTWNVTQPAEADRARYNILFKALAKFNINRQNLTQFCKSLSGNNGKPAYLTLYDRYRNLYHEAYPRILISPKPLTQSQIARERRLEEITRAAQDDWDPSAENWTAFVNRLPNPTDAHAVSWPNFYNAERKIIKIRYPKLQAYLGILGHPTRKGMSVQLPGKKDGDKSVQVGEDVNAQAEVEGIQPGKGKARERDEDGEGSD